MKFFIGIVFIAELIIALTVVVYLCKADRAVLRANKYLDKNKKDLKELLVLIKELISMFPISQIKDAFYSKKHKFIFSTSKRAFVSVCSTLFKMKYRKILIAYRLLVMFYETYKQDYLGLVRL